MPAPDSRETVATPRKAYLIQYKIVNEAECLIYADSCADALRRFDNGEGYPEVTHNDYRLGRPTAKRWASEDE